MSIPDIIARIVADFEDRLIPDPTPRRLVLPDHPGKIDAVIGMRRTGKTWLMFERIRTLEKQGIPRSRILYVNFEDERLPPLDADALHLFPEALYRRHPEVLDQERYFFFDEIQNVPGWERFVRRLIDERGVWIMVTGSSARLLGREVATSLRGRSLATELLPFSFAEALVHQGVDLPRRWPPPAKGRALLSHLLGRYLTTGGFPEVQGVADPLRVRILQDYVQVVVLRDVAERHGISNLVALRQLVRRLTAATGGRFSINKLYNDFRSQGIAVSKDALHAYVDHLEDAYLLFTVPIHTQSEAVRNVHPRTCYLVDPGLATASSYRASEDLGHLLENTVYLELRRRGHEIAYVQTKSGYEVDFLATPLVGSPLLVQVCADLSEPATRARELRALSEAMREQDTTEGLIVTMDERDDLVLPEGRVRVTPAWQWLLEA